jgi:hypothetical protein
MFASLLTAAKAALSPPAGSDLVRYVEDEVARMPAEAWRVGLDDMWCHVWPRGHRERDQGWKLHVSATSQCAGEAIRRVVPILLRNRCAFKLASTLDRLDLLNAAHYPRAGAGKFMTVYPADDAQFRQLAELLAEAATDLYGPRILSDTPYRPGSVVHYRYGGFRRSQILSNDAELVLTVEDPDGRPVPDRREIFGPAPGWAPAPFPSAPHAPPPAKGPVLLNGRFVVREAIRHSNRGGVFRAADTHTGRPVIVKQARRHVLGNAGVPAVDALRHEAEVLTALAPLGLTPRPIDVFDQDGDLFLVEEVVDGMSLRLWVRQRADVVGPSTPDHPGVAWRDAVPILEGLVDLLSRVHEAGWVVRDLSPSNLLVTVPGELRLIDVEFAARPGLRPAAGGTPGYIAPEQAAGAPVAPAVDNYSAGSLMFLLASGIDPVFAPDGPGGRPAGQRMREWLDRLTPYSETARRVLPAVIGLTDADARKRWTLATARSCLTRPAGESGQGGGAAPEAIDRLILDCVDELCDTVDLASSERLWRASCLVGSVDPGNVQHGTAGVLAGLVRAAEHGVRQTRIQALLPPAVEWTLNKIGELPQVLPGLYFGRSGTAWALDEAADQVGDEAGRASAADLAAQVPLWWPNADVAHGMSGAGLTQLRFLIATGEPRFAERLSQVADMVTAAAVRRSGRLRWPVPADFDSRLAGLSHYGYAHGIAGVGYFLLAAGLQLGRDDLVSLADQAGQELASAAVESDGAALWPTATEGANDAVEHWCSGSAGVGTFLIRLWQQTGADRYLHLAEAAARAAWRRRWYASTVYCHGLAGIGEYLLDLAAAIDGPYRAWATDIGELVRARSAIRNGRLVPPDETGTGFGAEFGVGLAGTLTFLLRLRYGGPRQWMPDPAGLLDSAAPSGGRAEPLRLPA